MAQSAAAAVSNPSGIFLLPWVEKIIQGGSVAVFDVESAPFVREGVLRELGLVAPSGGVQLSMDIKSTAFIQVDGNGMGYEAGKPIHQRQPKLQLKINAPSMRTLGLALLAGTPAAYTQAALVADTQFSIAALVLDVWYYVGALSLTKLTASKVVDAAFTDLVKEVDYQLDTSAGLIKFLSSSQIVTAGCAISVLYQAAAITAAPRLAIGAVPAFVTGGLHIYRVVLPAGTRTAPQLFVDRFPRVRIEPSGNIDLSFDKPAEITLDVFGLPSPEIPGAPFGYAFQQIAGDLRGSA